MVHGKLLFFIPSTLSSDIPTQKDKQIFQLKALKDVINEHHYSALTKNSQELTRKANANTSDKPRTEY